MKKITFLLLLIPLLSFSQTKEKNARDTFEVSGNCEMCKKRIESATLSLKGVKYVAGVLNQRTFQLFITAQKFLLMMLKRKLLMLVMIIHHIRQLTKYMIIFTAVVNIVIQNKW